MKRAEKSPAPSRRPLAERRRVLPPYGFPRGGRRGRTGRLLDSLAAANRVLYGTGVGRWLRRRLDRDLEVSRVDVRLGRGDDGLHGLKIAWLSDLHAGSFAMEPDIVRLFERVAGLEPDLVCLGGDLIDTRPEDSLLLGKGLALLRPPLGTFAVPGNHEHYADPGLRVWRSCLEEHGVEILLNSGRRLTRRGSSFWLAGVDDLSRGRPELGPAMQGAEQHEPAVLLAHHPDFFPEAAGVGVDLTLSGHTHAGQITFRGRTFLRQSRLGFWRGRFEREGAQLYVGRGAGTTGLPLRIHARGEIPLLELQTRD